MKQTEISVKKRVGMTVVNTTFTVIFLALLIVCAIVTAEWTLTVPEDAESVGEALGVATGAVLAGMLFVLLKFIIFAAGLVGFFWSLGGLRMAKIGKTSYSPKVSRYNVVLRVLNFILLFGSIALIVANIVQLAIL